MVIIIFLNSSCSNNKKIYGLWKSSHGREFEFYEGNKARIDDIKSLKVRLKEDRLTYTEWWVAFIGRGKNKYHFKVEKLTKDTLIFSAKDSSYLNMELIPYPVMTLVRVKDGGVGNQK